MSIETHAQVSALVAISRTVGDLARTEAFYRDGLGFSRVAPPEPIPPALLDALGLAGLGGQRLRMRLGHQIMDFLAFDTPGLPYPADRRATDPWFQHAAIVVRDMDAAYAQLGSVSAIPITRGGPQVLPPTSGGVSAYKFRDPDGHPLELIAFPDGPSAGIWADAPGLFLGIDHSAITVTEVAASLAFFRDGLGLSVATRGLNQGPEQAALDGVAAPLVDVIGLAPADRATPHVELLHYRTPERHLGITTPFGPRDRATTRLVFAVDSVHDMVARLHRTHPGLPIGISRDGRVAALRGPDGHGVILVAPTSTEP